MRICFAEARVHDPAGRCVPADGSFIPPKSSPKMKSRFRFFPTVLFLILPAAWAVSGEPGVELLSNGRFGGEEAGERGLPAGWSPNGEPDLVRWERGGRDDAALVLSVKQPGQTPAVFQEVTLPEPLPSALLLRGEVRTAGIRRGESSWHSGRMLVTYLDEGGRAVGDAFTLDRLEGTSDWREVRRQFPVPAGARRARLELQLLRPAEGALGFRDVSLLALDESEAQAWRIEANARIREHRMAPLRVRVEDAQGRPVEGAEVAVFMRRHAYPFGTAVKAALLVAPEGDVQTDIYRTVVERFFNYATFEGALKVRPMEVRGLGTAVAALGWLRERDIAVRGHVLTWPSFTMSSSAEVAAKDDPAALRAVMRRLFDERLAATAPFGIVDWDVVNEPTVHNDLIRILGEQQVAEWFRWAREGAPDARLYLNENNVEFGAGNGDETERWIKLLIDAGAPLGGLGWQGHMWHRTLPSGQNILDDLERFAPYGLPIQITEYDTHERFEDEDEARFLDEFLTAWFSHPITAGFIMWGFQDAYMWNGNGPLFRADWSLKPSGRVWMEKVFKEWWTEARVLTSSDGTGEIRGFLGDYEIEVRHGEAREVIALRLDAGGAESVVRLGDAESGGAERRTLVSSNPYTTGGLPPVVPVKGAGDGEGVVLPIAPAISAVAPGGGSVAPALYLRFEVGGVDAGALLGASLRVKPAAVPSQGMRVRVHVMSYRFVPQGGEAGLDWTPVDVASGRAPGREGGQGEFRLGDAAVIYLGDVFLDGNEAVFTSSELLRAVKQAGAAGLTLLCASTGATLERGAITLELRLKK